MSEREDAAWVQFMQWIERARPSLDGCVPVALIAMPIDRVDGDGGIMIRMQADGRIIWPADFPVEDRGPLLEQLARPYRMGKVTR